MNIEEKRNLLEVFCEKRHDCVSCPLKDTDIDCINFFECSDDVIEKAYNLVFGTDCCDDCEFYECADFDFPCKDCINNYGGSGLNNCFKPINSVTVA